MPDYHNQYLLTKREDTPELPDSFERRGSVSGYTVYASDYLESTVIGDELAIMGDILDPFDPTASNEDIAERVTSDSNSDSLFEELQRYSGRFVVVAESNNGAVVVPDAAGQRRVLYSEDARMITSSPKLYLDAFGYEQRPEPDVAEFLNSDVFWDNDAAWPGTRTADERLSRILPNHYLNVANAEARRRPLYQPPVDSRQEAAELIENILRGTFASIVERFDDVEMSLTAGWDSRLLLAAADEVEDQIRFQTSISRLSLDHPDIRIPMELADTLDLEYRVLRTRSPREDFKSFMKDNYLNPRPRKLTRRQRAYADRAPPETVSLNGNSGEIMRTYFDRIESATPESISRLYYYPDSEFARGEFAEWVPGAKEYSDQTGIDISDLLYWEQRMGNWAARYAYERDITGNPMAPFNNYNLLLAGLSIPEEERTYPQYTFFEELIEQMRPEALSQPINPRSTQRKIKDKLHHLSDEHKSVARAKSAFLWTRSKVR